ncbi:hypothetical protein SAMN05216228_100854 [Rhizobium tibeticum]|uniref:Uncharacterized protein n=1 Tax=Rhizobium tibeticum TaxID=501024 RepID=A0A1H8JU42_9HYPH|nr:hypothetical protein RTCCBAU85039_2404 [Rhizobium tibeticum]SEN84025.1 hypothetical protein SAMN05216228_100854 [Rhizobium tibeticum]
MVLPADQRAHYITRVTKLLTDQIRACNLPTETSTRIFGLLDQISESADALRNELNPYQSTAPARPSYGVDLYGGNVVPLRRA